MLNEMFTGHVPQGAGYQNITSVSQEHSYLDPLVDLMIQQLPQQRPASILEIKRELIGRKNAFVAIQKLDAAKRIVIPMEQPHTVAPLRLVGADWNNGALTLELDRIPEVGWIERFKQPRVGYTAISYAHPHHFQFHQKTATVQADPQSAQEIINHFKQYVEMATQGYQADILAESAEREREERRQIKLAASAAQKRAEVLSKLKI